MDEWKKLPEAVSRKYPIMGLKSADSSHSF
jgi:hypothetical protein